jgi:hypothetical protein
MGLHRRENRVGGLKMAVSLGFWHFQHLGMEMTFSDLVKIRETVIFAFPPFSPLRGDQPPLNVGGRSAR